MSSPETIFQAHTATGSEPFLLANYIQVHHTQGGHFKHSLIKASAKVDADDISVTLPAGLHAFLLPAHDVVDEQRLLVLIFSQKGQASLK